MSAAPGLLPFEPRKGTSAVIVPVGSRGASGVLYVSSLPDVLSEGVLRVVQALGDAVGAVLDLVALRPRLPALARLQLSATRGLATIGQLVAGVAHEINNPLAFLKSNLFSLKAEVEDLVDKQSLTGSLSVLMKSSPSLSRASAASRPSCRRSRARRARRKRRFVLTRAGRSARRSPSSVARRA